MLQRLLTLATISITIALVGCAANVKQSSTSSPTPASTASTSAAPTATGSIAVVLIATPEVKQSGDWKSFTEEWQSAVPEAAAEVQASASLADTEASIAKGATLLARIKVNEFRYVSTAKRFMLGIIAGNAYMDIDVEYIQLPSGQILGTKKINTTSSAWEGIFSGVTPKQVMAVSKILVNDARGGGTAK